MKMKIQKNSTVLIKYQNGKIIEGKALDAKADCVKIKTTRFGIGILRLTVTKWYSFSHPQYTLVVEQLPS